MSPFATITTQRPLLLVGCGRMGGALLAGWLERGLDPAAVRIIEPARHTVTQLPSSQVAAAASELPSGLMPGVVALAVKPQMMDDALSALPAFPGALILSIAAGKGLGYFRAHLGERAAVVRAMPNTPAAIGRGMTVAVANAHVDTPSRALAEALLSAVGKCAWIDDEALMDAVTAVSGSGPAYVFYLAECLAAAGVAAGLPDALSRTLAIETVAGAGALLAEPGADPQRLRQAVTSPAGTTAAALAVLMAETGLEPLLRQAVIAAAKRSRELG